MVVSSYSDKIRMVLPEIMAHLGLKTDERGEDGKYAVVLTLSSN